MTEPKPHYYVANPDEIDEHMDADQLQRLAYWLHYVIEHGYGSVTITISNRHVHRIEATLSEKLPNEGRGRPM